MSRCIFVYGTLMLSAGRDVGRRLASEAEYLGHGSVAGRLYDMGKWPGLVASRWQDDRVHGEVWRMHQPEASLPWLDEYEGIKPNVKNPEYARIVASAKLTGGSAAPVWLYTYLWPLSTGRLLPEGRWPPAWHGHEDDRVLQLAGAA
jgi:gamma-glutamylcyclotransferase (GGCT)/AIG2-like uncharacterized protein YtfP